MPEKPPTATQNLPEYSVSELSHALKRTVEDTYSYVRVRGEISGCKRASSGHLYMTLKDHSSVIDGVCWRGVAARLSIHPEDGLEVIVTGKLTTYAARSKYQLVIESMELAGEGALLKLLEERRKKLAAEGLFDESRKQPLPFLPEVIGVVTSPTGAVIQDILHRLSDRFPRNVLLWPVPVQGESAADRIAAAIDGFNLIKVSGTVPRPDLLIVARGGGSLEDLWAFNEENVVRSTANSIIPVISAVGHETDWTLIDHAADQRAPTPTAAAEIAVPVRTDLVAQVMDNSRRMIHGLGRLIQENRIQLEGLARGLPDAVGLLRGSEQHLDDLSERFRMSIRTGETLRRQKVDNLTTRLRSPKQLLDDASEKLDRESQAMATAWSQFERRISDRTTQASDRLSPIAVKRQIDSQLKAVDELGRRSTAAMTHMCREASNIWNRFSDLLESYSFERVMERGFTVVIDGSGKTVTSVKSIKKNDAIELRFSDGKAHAMVTNPKTAKRTKAATEKNDKRQGDLL
tara:strand:+ start:2180 stop:3733 length:1554 start_codon:yes stop_codon:yes gene_type:complete